MARPAPSILAALLLACAGSTAMAQAERYELDALDRWRKVAESDPASEEAQLLAARKALVDGEATRAKKLVNGFLERFPLSRYRADALLLKGDAIRAEGDEYEALYEYEEICRRYSASEAFIPALEREYAIACEYADGLKRRFWGTVRIVNADEDAQELLIRVQERLPGSELAERACMRLADYYFARHEMIMASEAYSIFIENFPRSANVTKARLRLIYSYLAGFRGPEYDASSLLEARAKLRSLKSLQPGLAQQVGADGILLRIEESQAAKLLSTADWYLKTDDPISAELFIRRLVQRHPSSIATLEALRIVPLVLPKLPESVIREAPDYRTLRKQLLGVEWDDMSAPIESAEAPAAPITAPAAAPSPEESPK
ncbi:MAG: outer membrane protein assembly factor BamD [Phycisphaerales bacterium]